MGIVDVFDALTTARPYKAALSVSEAAAELRREVARRWRRADLVLDISRTGPAPMKARAQEAE